ncbi:MAG TPA: autotransporter assembly complex family protein [Burkholderiales bacterium]
MRTILQLVAAGAVELPVRTAAAILGFLAAGLACAQVQYRVEIDAPGEMAQTLRQGLNLARWQNDPQMTPDQLRRLADEAVREARETAATEGYFSAAASVAIEERPEQWVVRLTLDPGERTEVDDVDILFNGPATGDADARALLSRVREGWSLRRGQPFRQEDWEAAKRGAVRALSSWRYAAARIARSEALVDPATRRARLTVELDSGPPFRFGELRISGVRRYSERLVENLSPFRAGNTYDRDQLLVYQRRLLESGYFVSVQADIDPAEGRPEASPVRVAVIEASTQHFEAGIGYSTDAGPRLEARYSNQDVLDSAWRFRSGLRLDDKIRNLQVDFDSPPRPGARWNSLFARARETDIQNESTSELAAGVSHNWGAEVTPSALILSAHIEEQRVAGEVTDDRHAIYGGFRRSYRSTDDFIAPRSGYLAMFEVGGALPGLASRAFLRGIISASLFIPNGRRGDILLRGQAGRVLADSREGIPASFLFRTGGDQTVRGYGFESLGVQQGNAIVGGRRLLVTSAEYTHWFTDSWGLAGFVDAGNAWDGDSELEAVVGVGLGARFRTPIGPIRADVAYGEQTGQLRLHFSVGYSF